MKIFPICKCSIAPCENRIPVPGRTEFFIDFIDGPLQGVRLFTDIDDDGINLPCPHLSTWVDASGCHICSTCEEVVYYPR